MLLLTVLVHPLQSLLCTQWDLRSSRPPQQALEPSQQKQLQANPLQPDPVWLHRYLSQGVVKQIQKEPLKSLLHQHLSVCMASSLSQLPIHPPLLVILQTVK